MKVALANTSGSVLGPQPVTIKSRTVVEPRPSDAWTQRSGNDHLKTHRAVEKLWFRSHLLLLLENTRGPAAQCELFIPMETKRDGKLNIVCGVM